MKIGSAFPSKYIKADDLQGRHVRVQISKVEMEDIGDDGSKPIVYFQGKDKGLILNRTNAHTISDAYGDDTDNWNGCEIELFPTKVLFQSRMVGAIRINIPPQKKQEVKPAPKQETMPDNGGSKDYDDEIPF